ncbi:MAG: hypothetical protein AAB417_01060 [Patescibacteria group bacterium]
MDTSTHNHLKLKFCVSGAAETGHCSEDALDKAKAIGREIAQRGGILVNGATTGFPYWAAIGAKEAGGATIGISPAATEKEHREVFDLPLDYLDMIIYTGAGMSGRNLLLTRSTDAVIIGCGRMGTLNEFTIAFEDKKPIGILTGTGGTTELIDEVIAESHRAKDNPLIVYSDDPKELIDKLIALLKREKVSTV